MGDFAGARGGVSEAASVDVRGGECAWRGRAHCKSWPTFVNELESCGRSGEARGRQRSSVVVSIVSQLRAMSSSPTISRALSLPTHISPSSSSALHSLPPASKTLATLPPSLQTSFLSRALSSWLCSRVRSAALKDSSDVEWRSKIARRGGLCRREGESNEGLRGNGGDKARAVCICNPDCWAPAECVGGQAKEP